MKKILTTLLLSLVFFPSTVLPKNDLYEKIDLFGDVLENVKKEYVDEIDQAKMIESAINGVL